MGNRTGRKQSKNGSVAIVGSGPNGLAAAMYLARAGCHVHVLEKAPYLGGGLSSRELIQSGYFHDVCAAVPAIALESEFSRKFELKKRVQFATPEISYAHPLVGQESGLAFRDIDRTIHSLGVDGRRWERLFEPLVSKVSQIAGLTTSSPMWLPKGISSSPSFAFRVFNQAFPLTWDRGWESARAPALLTGVMAHSGTKIPSLAASGVGLMLAAMAHRQGWPFPEGGMQSIANAMIEDIQRHGGTLTTDVRINDLNELNEYEAIVLNTSLTEFVRIARSSLPDKYVKRAQRFKYGAGSAKVDFILSEPIPWRDHSVKQAGTIHLGGTRKEITLSEAMLSRSQISSNPYVLVTQPSSFDGSRAPAGKHIGWAYMHVPHGSRIDPTELIIRRIEKFAPGFRDVIVDSYAESAVQLEARNPNYVGGDISSGEMTLNQLLRRPTLSPAPWDTPIPGVYFASGATSPGPSIHGLAGYRAARLLARKEFGIVTEPSLSST